MPTYKVTVVELTEVIKEVTVVSVDSDAENLQAAVNLTQESDFTTTSTRLLSEEIMDFTEV